MALLTVLSMTEPREVWQGAAFGRKLQVSDMVAAERWRGQTCLSQQ